MTAKYAWIFQILIFTHFGINLVPMDTYKWDGVYNRPNWENIGPQSHLFKKSPILLWKTGPYTSTFTNRHGRTKRRTDLKFGIFPFDYKGNIWAKWEENLRGLCGRHLLISYGMTLYVLHNNMLNFNLTENYFFQTFSMSPGISWRRPAELYHFFSWPQSKFYFFTKHFHSFHMHWLSVHREGH